MSRKYYLIYRIDNLVNGRYYIGCHQTHDPGDDYMGSGNLVKISVKTYGIENFKKELLFCAFDEESMQWAESIFVTDTEVKNRMCYNLVIGGGLPPSARGKHTYTNGEREIRIFPHEDIPIGFYKGRTKSGVMKAAKARKVRLDSMTPEDRYKESAVNIGKKRYYNIHDTSKKLILGPDEVIPDGFVLGHPKVAPKFNAYDPITNKRKKFYSLDEIPDGWVNGTNWRSSTNEGYMHYYNDAHETASFKSDEEAFAKGYIHKGNIGASKALKGTNVFFNPVNGESRYIKIGIDPPDGWFSGRISKKYKSFCAYRKDSPDKFYVITVGTKSAELINSNEYELGIPSQMERVFGKYQYNIKEKYFNKKATHSTDNIPNDGFVFVKFKDIISINEKEIN